MHYIIHVFSWWRHQMETFSALLAICAGNSPVSGEFPAQRPMTRSFDVFFDVRVIKRLSKHSRGWWFETLSHPLWRHRNVVFGWDLASADLPIFFRVTSLALGQSHCPSVIEVTLKNMGRLITPLRSDNMLITGQSIRGVYISWGSL